MKDENGPRVTRISDDTPWIPQQTVGRIWTAAYKFVSKQSWEQKALHDFLLSDPIVPILSDHMLESVKTAAFWKTYPRLIELVQTLWQEVGENIIGEIKGSTNDLGLLLSRFNGNYQDLVYAATELRSDRKEIGIPSEEYFDSKLWIEQGWNSEWFSWVCGHIFETLPTRGDNRELDFWQALIPPSAPFTPSNQTELAACLMLDSYYPIHLLSKLPNLAKKLISDESSTEELSEFEVDALNSAISMRGFGLQFDRCKDNLSFDAASASQHLLVNISDEYRWSDVLQLAFVHAASDLIDDIFHRRRYQDAVRTKLCAACGQPYLEDTMSRNRSYCSRRCKDRVAKRKQRNKE